MGRGDSITRDTKSGRHNRKSTAVGKCPEKGQGCKGENGTREESGRRREGIS